MFCGSPIHNKIHYQVYDITTDLFVRALLFTNQIKRLERKKGVYYKLYVTLV